MTELGLGNTDYLAVQDRQAAVCGSINAFTSMRGAVNDVQQANGYLVLSSKALLLNHAAQEQLMRDTLEQVRFDEQERLRELIAQQRARREQAVTGNGHGLAMAAASAGMSPVANLSHQLSGLAGIRASKQLDSRLEQASELAQFGEQLGALHRQLLDMSWQYLLVAEGDQLDDVSASCQRSWQGFGGDSPDTGWTPEAVREQRREIWVANTQVNFCAHAYPTVAVGHDDAAALTVLGGVLRNGFLHTAIREKGGAYGGGASQDSNIGAFRFFSYRDPRLGETLADFEKSVRWLLDSKHENDALEQAILGVIGSIDRPSSPAGEAKQDFHNRLFGRDHAHREAFRRRILEVSLEDLRRVAETYLRPEAASVAVVTSQAGLDAAGGLVEELGLRIEEL